MSIKASWAYGGAATSVHIRCFLGRLHGCWYCHCFSSMTSQYKSDTIALEQPLSYFSRQSQEENKGIVILLKASPHQIYSVAALVHIINKVQTTEYCIFIPIHVIILMS